MMRRPAKTAPRQKNRHGLTPLLCEFLRLFYQKGWVSGTGGGLCASTDQGAVLLAPTGVHKERIGVEDFFTVDPASGRVVRPPKNASLRPSECSAIFCTLINRRGAGSVMHSHALSAVLAADLADLQDHVVFERLEMLKGIRGVSNLDKHAVAVIHNAAREPDLTDQIARVLERPDFSDSFAVLVRDHGAYIWGKDIWEAKRHAEVYHFLFEAAVARSARHAFR